MAEQELNHHTFRSPGPLHVIFTSSGIAGEPQLTYQDPQRSLQFSGGDIEQVISEADVLISVTIGISADHWPDFLSILIPRTHPHGWHYGAAPVDSRLADAWSAGYISATPSVPDGLVCRIVSAEPAA